MQTEHVQSFGWRAKHLGADGFRTHCCHSAGAVIRVGVGVLHTCTRVAACMCMQLFLRCGHAHASSAPKTVQLMQHACMLIGNMAVHEPLWALGPPFPPFPLLPGLPPFAFFLLWPLQVTSALPGCAVGQGPLGVWAAPSAVSQSPSLEKQRYRHLNPP